MIPDLSQVVFPNYITGLMDITEEYFRGGYNYQTQHNGWTGKNLINQIKRFEGIIQVAPPDQGLFYTTDWFDIFEFPNGYKIQGILRYDTNLYLSWESRMLDENGEVVPRGTIPGCDWGYAGSYIPSGTPLTLSNFVIDITMMTTYYPDVDPAAGSANHGLNIGMTLGDPTRETNPYNLHVGTVYSNEVYGTFNMNIIIFSNLAQVDAYLHGHGNPYSGDTFSDEPIPGEPAGGDDTSYSGGGDGNYDDTSDPIDYPSLPTGGAIASGAVRAFRVSTQTLEAIQAKLWDDSIFNFNTWQKVIEQPMSAIIDLFMIPYSPEVEPSDVNIYVGNFNTGVKAPKVTSDFVMIDCGTLDVKLFWGSALDYSPYTHVEIFLPFIGIRKLSTEDVMNSTIGVKYAINVLSGECVAYIKCGQSVLYHFNGNCKQKIPLTGTSSDALKSNLQSIVSTAGAAVGGTGLMGAGVAAVGAGSAAAPALVAGGVAISAASAVAGSKVKHERAGDISGAAGIMDDFIPYLIIHRPKQSLAKGYNQFKGYPSNISSKLGNCKGYTEVEHVHLKGISGATDRELSDIEMLLKTGVII